jgi:hypothetical protein
MNINKKLDRMKQWAGERMGGEVKTDVSDDFRALEVEMGLRHEGQSDIHCYLCRQRSLTICRHGENAEVDESLCPGHFEAHRSAREREEPAHCILGIYDGHTRRGFRWRVGIWPMFEQ